MSQSKTDVKYWQRAVVRPSYISDGKKRQVEDWSVKIQHAGHRFLNVALIPTRPNPN